MPQGIGCAGIMVITLGVIFIIGLIANETNPTPQAPKDPVMDQFSAWDGSHFKLVELTKEGMNDASSFEHVKTSYAHINNVVTVIMQFRGKNAFGGMVLDDVAAEFTEDGQFIRFMKVP